MIIEKDSRAGCTVLAEDYDFTRPSIILSVLKTFLPFKILQDVKVQTILPSFLATQKHTPGSYFRGKHLTLSQAMAAQKNGERIE